MLSQHLLLLLPINLSLSEYVYVGRAPHSTTFLQPERRPRLDFSEVVTKLEHAFNEEARDTSLQDVLSWKTEKLQEVFLITIGALSVYTATQILVTILSGLLDIKIGFIKGFVSLISNAAQAVLDKFLIIKTPVVEAMQSLGRRRRNVDRVSQQVFEAIDKYSS